MKKTSNDLKKWLRGWKNASKELEKIKAAELQSKDYYKKNLPLLNAMLWYAYEHRTVSKTSGLIAMQKLFQKLHARSKKRPKKTRT